MKILIIGNGNSRFIRDYIRNIRKRQPEVRFFDLFTTESPVRDPHELEVGKIFSVPDFLSRIKKIKIISRTIALANIFLIRSRHYDIIHFHYAMPELMILHRMLKNYPGKLVITIFGSDFLRISDKRKIKLKPAFDRADSITFANEAIENQFLKFYGYNRSKTRICRFGLEPLDLINRPGSKSDFRIESGLPKYKVTIAIGYNYEKNQQHIEIIKKLMQLPENYKSNIHLALQMTYGSDAVYRESIINTVKTSGLSYTIFKKYLSEDSNASLKMACDIMIHLPKADAFSGAMQEHLCAGSVVITGEWLPYKAFEEKGIYFKKIRNFDELLPQLSECLEQLDNEKIKSAGNYDIIQSISNWNATSQAWIDLYSDLYKKDS